MAEKSEHEASQTGQDTEQPETEQDVKQDGQEGQTEATGYRESSDFVPDPTAMVGTLETSGTGGGQHESLRGTTNAFSDLPEAIENSGLPLYRGDIVQGDGTGQPAPHGGADAQVATTEDRADEEQKEQAEEQAPASDAGDVDGGTTRVAEASATTYAEQTISGAQDPNVRQGTESEGPNTTAARTTEDSGSEDKGGEEDSEKKDEEESKSEDKGGEEDSEKKDEEESKTTARKTTRRSTSSRSTKK